MACYFASQSTSRAALQLHPGHLVSTDSRPAPQPCNGAETQLITPTQPNPTCLLLHLQPLTQMNRTSPPSSTRRSGPSFPHSIPLPLFLPVTMDKLHRCILFGSLGTDKPLERLQFLWCQANFPQWRTRGNACRPPPAAISPGPSRTSLTDALHTVCAWTGTRRLRVPCCW